MIFRETDLTDVRLIALEPRVDDRGLFARAWCREEFAAEGLATEIAQANLAVSRNRGTLRGLHYQVDPHEEVKVIRCVAGAIWDVVVDLRPSSPTYLGWIGLELSAQNRLAVYVPEGCAHGYMTLEDETEVFYFASAPYAPEAERGIRWSDPTFGISWPDVGELSTSPKDASWPDFMST